MVSTSLARDMFCISIGAALDRLDADVAALD
jgi:hypothetical protein